MEIPGAHWLSVAKPASSAQDPDSEQSKTKNKQKNPSKMNNWAVEKEDN